MAANNTQENATDVVSMKIVLNGTDKSSAYQVLSIEVFHCFNKISWARIHIADGDPSKQDFPISGKDEDLLPGNELDLQMGYHGQAKSVFKGIIVKQGIKSTKNKSSYLSIEAKDQFMKLAIGRRSFCFSDKKDSEIMTQIMSNAGFNAADTEIEDTPLQHAEMVQYQVSDWDFIVSRAEMNSMLVLTHNNKLLVQKPDTSKPPTKEITYGKEVIEFESEMDARTQKPEVKSISWDYKNQEVKEWEESSVSFTENGTPTGNELADKLNIKASPLLHAGHLKEEELKSWSSASLLKSRMAKNIGRVKVKGVPEIHPGVVIKLNGFGKRFSGNVLVTAVRHTYKTTIWETDIHFGLPENWFYEKEDIMEKPAAGLVPGIHGLQIGIVTQLENDPEKEERIKIRLPMIQGEDSIWARTASMDAGKERGAFFRPEIGDEVIVGFVGGDPRQPVILGMLHSSAHAAPFEAKDANNEKGLVTRSKLKLVFDDEKKSIQLETPKGKKIIINEEEDVMLLTDQHNNKIELGKNGIVIESNKDIALKTGTGAVAIKGKDIQLEATVKLAANGKTAADLTSSGKTVVKGAIVNIN